VLGQHDAAKNAAIAATIAILIMFIVLRGIRFILKQLYNNYSISPRLTADFSGASLNNILIRLA
jgi:hypothetical protein